MSTTWIWAIWTVVMIGWSYLALVYDMGPYELLIFMAGAVLVSVAAVLFQGTLPLDKPGSVIGPKKI